jgi:hypothetical protein
VGPDGLELAFWPKNYPTGNYIVVVDDLVDSVQHNSPLYGKDPVSYTINVIGKGFEFKEITGTIGLFQTSPSYVFNIPSRTAGAAVHTRNLKTRAEDSVVAVHKR